MLPVPDVKGLTIEQARQARIAWHAEQAKLDRMYPELHLTIKPTPVGMALSLVLYQPDGSGRRSTVGLRQAVWAPRDVTEEKVVDWGRRALASWLEDHPLVGPHLDPRQ